MRVSLARVGDWLRDHARAIRAVQWVLVLVYGFLLLVPVFLPLPDDSARILNNLTLFAQFVFWGIWWPFVLLSMVLFGRLWCGMLCPEGSLTEWTSRHGLGRAIPRWMRWNGWPVVGFASTTLYGQLVSVYQYPKAAMLVLGGSTLAAIAVGLVYTRGKRAWCRHLCPVTGVFALLGKLAPMHYRVDETRWLESAKNRRITIAVDCAPLMPLRHMKGNSGCHMCARCSGYRDAISLSARSPAQEVVELGAVEATAWQTVLILYGLLGIAIGAFHWTASPWFIAVKQACADWLAARDIVWPLENNAPWWLLTHYPQVNDTFTWLDGGMIVAYILATSLLLGSTLSLCLAVAVRSGGRWHWQRFHHLAQSLIPQAGIGVFLGLSTLTVSLLKAEGLHLWWVSGARLGLLLLANVWSLWLARGIVRGWTPDRARQSGALVAVALALLAVDGAWALLFWYW
ncbi:4Fe-4S binding protein [Paludibacterium yongneupense]|uniref:4Fe-4S binding protein n=1 Tax=Paludibacterium yongneupense TaxID=400061 RepID=UPI000418F3DE|nr:4Fe-4S binding protein [Paludibacterium yongneupense]